MDNSAEGKIRIARYNPHKESTKANARTSVLSTFHYPLCQTKLNALSGYRLRSANCKLLTASTICSHYSTNHFSQIVHKFIEKQKLFIDF
ncbi:MAG: hypothetical protein LKK11_02505 [Acidaminococcus sp.]|jgi:hypothetical protein|nr:hypothetical protein [Acidaminococcus sp.]